MVQPSAAFVPVMMRGLKVDARDPFLFDFLIDNGNTGLALDGPQFKAEGEKLIKYFLASLTIKEEDLWVNLSPYEKDRMIPADLGKTELGRDMLAQDYILKQLTASLIYPERDLGKKFWDKVYAAAREKFGTTEVPVDTFNKVWIQADKAKVLERHGAGYVVNAHLKVMLEADYVAANQRGADLAGIDILQQPRSARQAVAQAQVGGGVPDPVSPAAAEQKDTGHLIRDTRECASTEGGLSAECRVPSVLPSQELAKQILREVIIPAIETEVNEGANFAPLRQMFYAMILASWYKQSLKNAFLSQVYANTGKVEGVGYPERETFDPQGIYQRYLQAYKTGVFNLIKEETDLKTGEALPRKYFSGGLRLLPDGAKYSPAMAPGDQLAHEGMMADLSVRLADPAMSPHDQMRFWPSRDLEPFLARAGDEGLAVRRILTSRMILLAMEKMQGAGQSGVLAGLERAHQGVATGGFVPSIFSEKDWQEYLARYVKEPFSITIPTGETGLSRDVIVTNRAAEIDDHPPAVRGDTPQPVWKGPIPQMLRAGYTFVPQIMDGKGFVYRAVHEGVLEGILSGRFEDQSDRSPSTEHDPPEKSLGIYYLSHFVGEAHTWTSGSPNGGILVMPASFFNEEVKAGRAAIHKNYFHLYRFPFLTQAPRLEQVPYLIVSKRLKAYMDQLKNPTRLLTPQEKKWRWALLKEGAPRIVAWPEEAANTEEAKNYFEKELGVRFEDNPGQPADVFPRLERAMMTGARLAASPPAAATSSWENERQGTPPGRVFDVEPWWPDPLTNGASFASDAVVQSDRRKGRRDRLLAGYRDRTLPTVIMLGDKHGDAADPERLLQRVRDFVKDHRAGDGTLEIVWHGDSFDKGDFNVEVFDHMKELKRIEAEHPGLLKVSLLWGNHDVWLVEGVLFGDKSSFLRWESPLVGGSKTLQSFHKAGRNIRELALFMLEHFDLFHVDAWDMLHVHSWVPMKSNGRAMTRAELDHLQKEWAGLRGRYQKQGRSFFSGAPNIREMKAFFRRPLVRQFFRSWRENWQGHFQNQNKIDGFLDGLDVNGIFFAHTHAGANIGDKIFGIDVDEWDPGYFEMSIQGGLEFNSQARAGKETLLETDDFLDILAGDPESGDHKGVQIDWGGNTFSDLARLVSRKADWEAVFSKAQMESGYEIRLSWGAGEFMGRLRVRDDKLEIGNIRMGGKRFGGIAPMYDAGDSRLKSFVIPEGGSLEVGRFAGRYFFILGEKTYRVEWDQIANAYYLLEVYPLPKSDLMSSRVIKNGKDFVTIASDIGATTPTFLMPLARAGAKKLSKSPSLTIHWPGSVHGPARGSSWVNGSLALDARRVEAAMKTPEKGLQVRGAISRREFMKKALSAAAGAGWLGLGGETARAAVPAISDVASDLLLGRNATTHLIESFRGTTSALAGQARSRDQALSGIALLASGNTADAKTSFDLLYNTSGLSAGVFQPLANTYNVATGTVGQDGAVLAAPQIMAGIFALRYYHATKDDRGLAFAKAVISWLRELKAENSNDVAVPGGVGSEWTNIFLIEDSVAYYALLKMIEPFLGGAERLRTRQEKDAVRGWVKAYGFSGRWGYSYRKRVPSGEATRAEGFALMVEALSMIGLGPASTWPADYIDYYMELAISYFGVGDAGASGFDVSLQQNAWNVGRGMTYFGVPTAVMAVVYADLARYYAWRNSQTMAMKYAGKANLYAGLAGNDRMYPEASSTGLWDFDNGPARQSVDGQSAEVMAWKLLAMTGGNPLSALDPIVLEIAPDAEGVALTIVRYDENIPGGTIYYTNSLEGTPVWQALSDVALTAERTVWIDATARGQAKRFYRFVATPPPGAAGAASARDFSSAVVALNAEQASGEQTVEAAMVDQEGRPARILNVVKGVTYEDAVVDPSLQGAARNTSAVLVDAGYGKLVLTRWAKRASDDFTEEEKKRLAESPDPIEELAKMAPDDIASIRQTIYDRSSGVFDIQAIVTDNKGREHFYRVHAGNTTSLNLRRLIPPIRDMKAPGAFLQASMGNQGDLIGNFTVVSQGQTWEIFGAANEDRSSRPYRCLIQFKDGQKKASVIRLEPGQDRIRLYVLDGEEEIELAPDQVDFVLVAHALVWKGVEHHALLKETYVNQYDLRNVLRLPSNPDGVQIFYGQIATSDKNLEAALDARPLTLDLHDPALGEGNIHELLASVAYRKVAALDQVKEAGDYYVQGDKVTMIIAPARYPINAMLIGSDGRVGFVEVPGASGRRGVNFWTVGDWILRQAREVLKWEQDPEAVFVLDSGMDPTLISYTENGEEVLAQGRENFNAVLSVVDQETRSGMAGMGAGVEMISVDENPRGVYVFSRDGKKVGSVTYAGGSNGNAETQEISKILNDQGLPVEADGAYLLWKSSEPTRKVFPADINELKTALAEAQMKQAFLAQGIRYEYVGASAWGHRGNRIEMKSFPEQAPWLMDAMRPVDMSSPLRTSYDTMPVVTSLVEIEKMPALSGDEFGTSGGVFLGMIRRGDGVVHPAAVKMGYPALGELKAIQVLGNHLGFLPEFYGVIKNREGRIVGYAMSLIAFGEKAVRSDDHPDWREINRRIKRSVPGITFASKKFTRKGRIVGIDAGDYTSVEDVFDRYLLKHSNKEVRPPGGISLNARKMEMDVVREGTGVAMTIAPAMMEKIRSGDFSGLVPVVLRISPIAGPLPVLGMGGEAPLSQVVNPDFYGQSLGRAILPLRCRRSLV